MAVKRLGGAALTKAERISEAVTKDLEGLEKQFEKPVERNRGVYERVMLESVRPDPLNPRHLKLTWEELQRGIADLEAARLDPKQDKQAKIIESILAKAANFRIVGQLQPISVYRDDRGMLRIADGERRYWAARLCDWTEIDARVRTTKPAYLRLEQYSANVLREDLTTGEQLGNLELIIEEAAERGTAITSLNELVAFLGRPRGTMAKWWSVLRGPEDVKAALRQEQVTSLEVAYLAAQEPDAGRRAALLAGHVLPVAQPNAIEKPKRKKAGRPLKGVTLGVAKDLNVVRTLIEAVPIQAKFDNTDWTDARSVQETWKKFIKAVQDMLNKQSKAVGAPHKEQG